MSITGTVTTAVSADFTPTAAVSDIYVVKNGSGALKLMAKVGALDPVLVTRIEGSGTLPVSTADPNITYYLQPSGQGNNWDFYIGP